MACLYDVKVNCKGVLTPERFKIFYEVFHATNLS